MVKMLASKLGIEIKKYRPRTINVCDTIQIVKVDGGYDIYIDGVKQEMVTGFQIDASPTKGLLFRIERII